MNESIILILGIMLVLLVSGCIQENESEHQSQILENQFKPPFQEEEINYSDNLELLNTTENETEEIVGEYVILNFSDSKTNCTLDGYVTFNEQIIGLTKDGAFYLFKEVFENLTERPAYSTLPYTPLSECDYYCLIANLSKCYEEFQNRTTEFCFYFETEYYSFENHTILKSKCDLEETTIFYLYKRREFIQPESVKGYLDSIVIINKTEEDLETIHRFVSKQLYYLHPGYLSEWQEPLYTLKNHHGNCADFSVAVISMMRLYNSSLDCFVLLTPEHAVPFCHLGNKLGIYEQENNLYTRSLRKRPDVRNRIKEFIYSCFRKIGLPREGWTVEGIFNENEYYEFRDLDEFIDWIIQKWNSYNDNS